MLNLTNLVVFERRNSGTGVTWISYTADKRFWAALLMRAEGSDDPRIVTRFEIGNDLGRDQAKIRGLITYKCRKRSRFTDRLDTLDQELYERHARVGTIRRKTRGGLIDDWK